MIKKNVLGEGSLINRVLLFSMVFMLSISIVACDNGGDSDDDSAGASELTTVSYTVDPQKELYESGDEVTILATSSGPLASEVEVSWSFSISSGNVAGFPATDKDSATFTLGSAGSTFNISASTNQKTINGVAQIQGGNKSFSFGINASGSSDPE